MSAMGCGGMPTEESIKGDGDGQKGSNRRSFGMQKTDALTRFCDMMDMVDVKDQEEWSSW